MNEKIQTINDLLEKQLVWVQGNHTRIVKNAQGEFEVLAQKNRRGDYRTCWYAGFSELTAVSEFLLSENS